MARNTDPNRCRNPRRAALLAMKQIKDALQWSINRMTVSSTVADHIRTTIVDEYGTRECTKPVWRPRHPVEYPENRAAEWNHVIANADQMIEALLALRERAVNERDRCEAGIFV